MVVHIFNPSIWQAKAGLVYRVSSRIAVLHIETLENKQTNKKTVTTKNKKYENKTKPPFWGQRDSSAAKSTGSSCKGLRFDCQHPQGSSQLSSIPGNLRIFSDFHKHQAHTRCTGTCKPNIYTHKIKL